MLISPVMFSLKNWYHLELQSSSLAVLFYFRFNVVKLTFQLELDPFQFSLTHSSCLCYKSKMLPLLELKGLCCHSQLKDFSFFFKALPLFPAAV